MDRYQQMVLTIIGHIQCWGAPGLNLSSLLEDIFLADTCLFEIVFSGTFLLTVFLEPAFILESAVFAAIFLGEAVFYASMFNK